AHAGKACRTPKNSPTTRSSRVSLSCTWKSTRTTDTDHDRNVPALWMAKRCASQSTKRSCVSDATRCVSCGVVVTQDRPDPDRPDPVSDTIRTDRYRPRTCSRSPQTIRLVRARIMMTEATTSISLAC
ncbi:hypothetical protein LSTR_LSTR015894, partial [Laodelphax striatellus]